MNDNYWNDNNTNANDMQTFQDLDLEAIDESDLLFANAPTPYVNPDYEFDFQFSSDVSLNGDIIEDAANNQNVANNVVIESTADNVNNRSNNMVDNNNIHVKEERMSPKMSNEVKFDAGMTRYDTRKRKISFNDETDSEADSDVSDDESVVSSKRSKGKKSKGGKSYARKGNANSAQCMSRNAIAARENREKKKQYIKSLERENDSLRKKMSEISAREAITAKRCNDIESQLKYYKALLANDSHIAAMIKHVSEAPNFKMVGTSMFEPNAEMKTEDAARASKMAANDANNTRKSPRIANKHENVGICLHINNNNVSFELCNKCSEASKKLIRKRNEKEKAVNK